ncbi:hypothetical protein BJX68DRAFT_195715 [Aspergillus pseudodeflectus]|uniref:Protein SQS1 n=1 Tax=Aspergillus pseudodeflectus TaxID=176178 RepID=A0ABR4JJJ7_9EURO
MQEEARNTEGRSLWRTDTQLRHRAVQFVSAGNIEPAQKSDSTSTPSEDGQIQCPEPDHEPTAEVQLDTENKPMTDSITAVTTVLRPTVQQRSPTPEDSSEDEVVFRGRRNRKESYLVKPVQNILTTPGSQEDAPCEPALNVPDHGASTDVSGPRIASSINESPDYIQIDDYAMYRDSETSDEDQILADYIANMDDTSDDDDSSSSPNEDRDQDEDPKVEAPVKGSHDMVLDSDSGVLHSDGPEMSGDLDLDSLAEFVSFGRSKAGHKKSKFAAASTFADALELDPYYGFDIMDFSRPSLREKAKKGSDHFNFDVDEELEAEMLNAWNHDRLKKKSKKKEREQLRAQGLLGRRKNDPDLNVKYVDGIGIEDLKSEIRLFILSPKNNLSLPPMTKHRRMLVHDMAHVLRLTSKSRGKGSLRFPVLSKTTRTPKYTPKTISQLDRVLSREKFGPRALKAWDKTGARPNKAKAGQGNVSYMDGDVVGASAPEIGAENIGRAMLEKMGWSRGTALGATHNKGILLPVSHVVKNSKAGLG